MNPYIEEEIENNAIEVIDLIERNKKINESISLLIKYDGKCGEFEANIISCDECIIKKHRGMACSLYGVDYKERLLLAKKYSYTIKLNLIKEMIKK